MLRLARRNVRPKALGCVPVSYDGHHHLETRPTTTNRHQIEIE